MKKRVLYGFYLVTICVIGTEVGLRLLGFKPYHYEPFSIQSDPALCLMPDSLLGFRLTPGHFNVTINGRHSFIATHDENGHRITGNIASHPQKPIVHLHGCSYTYGFGVNDSESMGWLLQAQLPQMKIESFSVPGYGNLQAYLILKQQALQGTLPDFVIINYCGFHNDRNVLSPEFRRDLALGFAHSGADLKPYINYFKYPYIYGKEGDNINLAWCSWQSLYTPWPLRMNSALINDIQNIYDQIKMPENKKLRLSEILILEIFRFCQSHNVQMLLTGLTQNDHTKEILSFFIKKGVPVLDAGLNLEDPHWQNYPDDSHPNAAAHAYFAKRIAQYLRENKIEFLQNRIVNQ